MLSIEQALGALALATEEPRRMPLQNPATNQPIRDAEGKEGYVDVYSADSSIARRHDAERDRRVYKAGRFRTTPEIVEAEAVDKLTALTAGWYLLTAEGEPLGLEFTTANARRLYGFGPARWIREQVDVFAGERGNFMQGSSPNSSNGRMPSSELTDKP